MTAWLQTLPELPVMAGIQVVLDPKNETGRWPRRSPRGVIQIDEDSGETLIVMPYRNPGEGLAFIKLPTESRLDLEHRQSFFYVLTLLPSDLSWYESIAMKAVYAWHNITDDDRMTVALAAASLTS